MIDERSAVLIDLYDTLAWVDWPVIREGIEGIVLEEYADPRIYTLDVLSLASQAARSLLSCVRP